MVSLIHTSKGISFIRSSNTHVHRAAGGVEERAMGQRVHYGGAGVDHSGNRQRRKLPSFPSGFLRRKGFQVSVDCSFAARINSRNSGCARLGRDFSSG